MQLGIVELDGPKSELCLIEVLLPLIMLYYTRFYYNTLFYGSWYYFLCYMGLTGGCRGN